MSRAPVLVLVSGGLDSLVLVRLLLRQDAVVHPVYMRFGLRWESVERFWLARWLDRIVQPTLRPLAVLRGGVGELYQGHWSMAGLGVPGAATSDRAVYLPGRNVLLLGYAAIYGAGRGLSHLALGTLAGNPFGDGSEVFFRRFAGCLSQALGREIRVAAPLRRFHKAELVAKFPEEPYALTFSCLQPRGRRHCGRCNKCAERRGAFRQAHVVDPTVYASDRRPVEGVM
ncbi:MAG: 7-cyano-7-deazaguanine synthase [Candidatus Omnitrophica bacterium]|nr:7-cyano-7-deazaguanine synthase [Candidatus Omnitrophota bacterium]